MKTDLPNIYGEDHKNLSTQSQKGKKRMSSQLHLEKLCFVFIFVFVFISIPSDPKTCNSEHLLVFTYFRFTLYKVNGMVF